MNLFFLKKYLTHERSVFFDTLKLQRSGLIYACKIFFDGSINLGEGGRVRDYIWGLINRTTFASSFLKLKFSS